MGPQSMNKLVPGHVDKACADGEVDVSSLGLEVTASVFNNLVRSEAQIQCLTYPALRPSDPPPDRWIKLAVTTFPVRLERGSTGLNRPLTDYGVATGVTLSK